VLQEGIVACEQLETWENDAILETLSAVAEHSELKRGDYLGMIRVAITGRTVSPPLTESMVILGRDRCILRLRDALNAL
jgi:glutamyl-tRNA synthetase